MKDIQRKTFAVSLAAVAAVGFSACSSNKSESAQQTSASPATSTAAPARPSAAMAGPSSDLIGGGCADYAALHPNGPASVTGMAQDPVATAASNNPLLSTLTAALSGKLNPNVNLVDTLNSGQYTVFAPTNAAFDKLPAGTVDTLLKPENKDQLAKVLKYHVVAGKVSSKQLIGMIKSGGGKAELKTVAGGTITATLSGGKVILTDEKGGTATVTIADVYQSNGVIHVIDTVLLPM